MHSIVSTVYRIPKLVSLWGGFMGFFQRYTCDCFCSAYNLSSDRYVKSLLSLWIKVKIVWSESSPNVSKLVHPQRLLTCLLMSYNLPSHWAVLLGHSQLLHRPPAYRICWNLVKCQSLRSFESSGHSPSLSEDRTLLSDLCEEDRMHITHVHLSEEEPHPIDIARSSTMT